MRRNANRVLILLLAAAAWHALVSPALADDKKKKPDEKPTPQVTVALPLGLAAGSTAKIVIRGIKLDQASEVQFQMKDHPAKAKILSKGKAALPDKVDAKRAGDTQVEVEVSMPADAPAGEANFIVITPEGKSPPHALLIAAKGSMQADKKAAGFRDAQPLALGQMVDGVIEHPRQVHVYRLDGQAGQKIVAEVAAARQGSLLDSLLTIYDAQGNIVATNDDFGGSPDSHLETKLPAAGPYYLSLIDAFDLGGPLHVFRLAVRSGQ